MFMKKLYITFAALIGLVNYSYSQSCGLATPDLTCTVNPAYPHTCPAVLPDGMAGQFYTTDITMWFPHQFYEPSVSLTVTMNSIHVDGVAGYPFGFSYTANPTTVDPSQNEFEAIRICGTPFSAGDYTVTISITVEAAAFGVSQTRHQNIDLPLHIAPSTQGNVAFTINNPSGCSPVASSFVTNFPSNGNPGYSYFWDLGNGFSTQQETVPPVDYTAPGPNDTFYVIQHSVDIDTAGYYLTNVQVTNVSCTDNPGNNPDVYLKIFNSLGQQIYNNSSSTIEGTPPYNFPLNIHLTSPPPYKIQAWDGDGGLLGADDNCADNAEGSSASITMSLPTTPGITTQIGTVGGLILNYTINHPVVQIQGSDTIHVSPNPIAPTVTLNPGLTFCQGDSVDLASTYSYLYQWFKGDTLLANQTAQHYYATTAGQYFVQVTNQYGCSAYSDTFKLSALPLPPVPTITFNSGTAMFETNLTTPYQLQWFYEGFEFAGQTAQTCAPLFNGHYFVRAENAAGCYSYSDTLLLKNVGIENINATTLDINLYPNPAFDVVTLQMGGKSNSKPVVKLMDINGQVIETKVLQNAVNGNKYNETIDISNIKKGVYLIQIEDAGHIYYKKVVKM